MWCSRMGGCSEKRMPTTRDNRVFLFFVNLMLRSRIDDLSHYIIY